MLVLYETSAGYALFKLLDDGKLKNPDDLYKEFETSEKANKMVSLQAFQKFNNTVEAMSAATALVEGKMSKNLKSFLEEELKERDIKKELLAVNDTKLAAAIAKKFSIKVSTESATLEVFRGIRSQIESLLTVPEEEMNAMSLGLSHSLSRFKLKFSPDKVDTMIVQAIALLDDLDKELNTYAMRAKEWYGWHFPELGKIIVDNLAFAKVVKKIGLRTNASKTDLSDILPEELENELKGAAEISMGTEISEEDLTNIEALCDQVISLTEYRVQLFEYLKNRMHAIAPNLTVMVGELVGARLIAHAGSLMNLAKYPASTVQILGAEKALFRAFKTNHDTPKYGLIYHASLIGQAGPKNKGKIARLLASKTALSCRVDALGDGAADDVSMGTSSRAMIDERIRMLENPEARPAKKKLSQKKHEFQGASPSYNTASDFTITKIATDDELGKKRKRKDEEKEEVTVEKEDAKDKKKKEKKEKKEKLEEIEEEKEEKEEKKKKKEKEKRKHDEDKEEKKKKKKKNE